MKVLCWIMGALCIASALMSMYDNHSFEYAVILNAVAAMLFRLATLEEKC